ncbi:BON domain-containing protein [Streptomyces sp. NPDC005009]
MNTQDAGSAGGTPAAASPEYRVAHLQDRLASGELGELGVRVEVRGGTTVLVTGTVPSAGCREEVLSTVREELTGLEVHCDIVVSETASPDHAEELS